MKDTKNEKTEQEVFHQIQEWNKKLEAQLSYEVIPIRSLVKVQLGSALVTAEYINENARAQNRDL